MASLEYRNHEDDCGLCLQEGSKKEARYFCENCKSYICDSCKDSHKKFQDLRKHTIVASQKQQHDDSSGPSDLTTSLSELSTQPSDECNVRRESSEPEDVTKDLSCKPSTSLSETEMISVTTPDKPGASRESERTGQKFQKAVNILKDVNFHLSTKINIRGLDEKDKSLVSGCCFMSGGEIVLIDGIKVKLLDSSFTLKDVLRMQRCPSGVAVLDNATAVVTAGVHIQVIHVLPSLKKGRSISAEKYCQGIDIAADQIYVLCCTPGKEDGEICIYDFELNLKKKIGKKLFSYMFKCPENLSVSRSGKIFVLDGSTIKCLAEDGKIFYKFTELAMPTGLYADDVGGLIVCARLADAIKIITDSGTANRILLSSRDGIDNPQCVTYRPEDGTLVVGCWERDFLLVYKAL